MKKLSLLILFCFTIFGWSLPSYAVDFTLKDTNGVTHQLSDHKGKWVIINFWATWCPPCRKEFPDLSAFHRKYRKGNAVVFGINYDEQPRKVRNFIEQNPVSFPVLLFDADQMGDFSNVDVLPTTFIINPKGELAAKQVGMVTQSMLEKYIKSISN